LGTGSGGDCNLYAVKILFDFQGVSGGARASIDGVAYDTSGCVPLKVDFEDTIATAKSYIWNFGDGSPDLITTNTNVSHSFTNVGYYTVRLISIDDSKCIPRDTTYTFINARTDRALLDFTDAKLQPCENLSFLFTNGSLSPAGKVFGPNSFVWDFGDNTPKITIANGTVTHLFAAPGTYTVKLLMKDTSFCNYPDSLVKTLRIAPNVVSKFNASKSGCAPFSAVFSNVSIAGQTFTWDFGDGSTYNGVTPPAKIYNSPGVYTVTLIASDPSTCNLFDTSTITITVHDKPLANFRFTPNPEQENTPTSFINTSTGATTYFWSFGDGDTSLQINPIHQFRETASFQACLTVTNSFGCVDSICQRVNSIISPLVDIPNAFTPNNDGINDMIFVKGFGIEKMNLMIFNRQGKLVFQSTSQNIGWDGKYKGQLQPLDVYAYVLEVQFADGNRVTKKGDITLLR
jgi:gliding motility-associated-like protein